MDKLFRKFYRNFYLKTGGFIPVSPFGAAIYPGDFFQIRNGEVYVLGNIFRNGIIDKRDVSFGNAIKLNPSAWNMSEGVSKPYSGRGNAVNALEGEFEFSKQVLSFSHFGSYIFKGNNPESVKILNWSDIQSELIVKLTQSVFSFRNLYVVSECATVSDWSLAVADAPKAELEIATETENFGLSDIFGFENMKTIQSRDIGCFNREQHRVPAFYKARKLTVQDEKNEVFVNELLLQLQGRNAWAEEYFDYRFNSGYTFSLKEPDHQHANVLDMLQANQLNASTALQYFRWSESSLDDVEQLFVTYGFE